MNKAFKVWENEHHEIHKTQVSQNVLPNKQTILRPLIKDPLFF